MDPYSSPYVIPNIIVSIIHSPFPYSEPDSKGPLIDPFIGSIMGHRYRIPLKEP